MNCLSRRAEADVPVTPAFPAPTAPPLPTPALPMPPVAVHVEVLAVGGETVGVVGSNELGPTVPTMGNTPVVGTAGAELTPRLPISIEPKGIPVRAPPPGVVGIVDVDVGVDDETVLVEPEPHIPDIPDVSSIPEDVDIPNGTDISDDVDVPVVVEAGGRSERSRRRHSPGRTCRAAGGDGTAGWNCNRARYTSGGRGTDSG